MFRFVTVYFRESSIHGFRYLVDKDLHVVERIFWALITIISAFCCGALIFKIGRKVQEDAMVTYTSETAIDIKEIAFPAVTFCPDLLTHNEVLDFNRIKKSLMENEITIDNVTRTELKFLQAVSLAVNDDFLVSYNLTIETDDVINYIKNLTWIWVTNRLYQDANFDDYYGVEFAEIIGPTGFCYTFNIKDAQDLLNLDNMPEVFNYSRPIKIMNQILRYRMKPTDPQDTGEIYPFHLESHISGYRSLIRFLSNYNTSGTLDTNHHESQKFQGIRHIIHNANDLFSRSSIYHQSMPRFSIILLIDPQLTLIDDALRDYQPEKRGCYIEGERSLKFFKDYTKENCHSECLANQTVDACGCAQFFMVREKSTRICGIQDMKCYQEIEGILSNSDLCQCFQACGEIFYRVELHRTEFAIYKDNHATSFRYGDYTHASEIIVKFKAAEFFPFLLQQQFTTLDFVTYIGGALGLFLGFSVLSFFEIIFYFSLRIIFGFKQSQKVADNTDRSNGTKAKVVQQYLNDYAENSTVHGMNQIVFEKRHIVERIFWFLLVTSSLLYCLISTHDLYLKYKTAPFLIGYEGIGLKNDKVPFPAVTFNSEVLLDIKFKGDILNYFYFGLRTDHVIEIQQERGTFERFFLQGMLCNDDFVVSYGRYENTPPLENITSILRNWSHIDWFAEQTATWNTYYQPEFVEILTKRGYGFSFNMLEASKLFTESISDDFLSNRKTFLKFPKKRKFKVESKDYPLTSTARPGNGLTLTLNSNQKINRYGLCKFYAFTVHSPYELASSYEDVEVVDFHYGADLEVLITPEIMRTDEDLRVYSAARRGCFFQDEKKLKYFKIYSRRNCELECLADYILTQNHTRVKVQCSPFFIVRDNSIPICDHRNELYVQYVKQDVEQNINGMLTDCGCLEECNLIKYNIEVFANRRNDYNRTLDKNEVATNVTINFKFKDVDVVPMRRYQPWTVVELLAQSGGLMGLFAGISFLSIIEIFYFLALRLCSNIFRALRKER